MSVPAWTWTTRPMGFSLMKFSVNSVEFFATKTSNLSSTKGGAPKLHPISSSTSFYGSSAL
jgi:hypothetical protein